MSDAPRAFLRIVYHVAECRVCPFNTRSVLTARHHAESMGHEMGVVKHYIMEPSHA